MEQYIHARLANDSTLTGLVGTNIFPTDPETNDQLPRIIYTIPDADPISTLTGANPLTNYPLTIEIDALDFDAIIPIGDRVRTLLQGWRDFPHVQGVFWKGSGTEQGLDSDGQTFYRMTQNYSVWG